MYRQFLNHINTKSYHRQKPFFNFFLNSISLFHSLHFCESSFIKVCKIYIHLIMLGNHSKNICYPRRWNREVGIVLALSLRASVHLCVRPSFVSGLFLWLIVHETLWKALLARRYAHIVGVSRFDLWSQS